MRGFLACLITNDDELYFLSVEFQFHTIHPLLNASKTLTKLSNTGIKIPRIKR